MTFCIRVLPSDKSPPNRVVAEIVLGDHRETFPLITTRWTIQSYQQQWNEALEAMVMQRVAACMLVTDIQPYRDSTGITYWALFREGEYIHAQERLMRYAPDEGLLLKPENVEKLIPPRIQGTAEEHERVSEWVVSMSDIVRHCRISNAIKGSE